jgi:hypothetical protein
MVFAFMDFSNIEGGVSGNVDSQICQNCMLVLANTDFDYNDIETYKARCRALEATTRCKFLAYGAVGGLPTPDTRKRVSPIPLSVLS